MNPAFSARSPAVRAIAAALALSLAPSLRAAVIEVAIDTGPLAGRAAALAFDLLDGDGTANSTVAVRDFVLTGGTLGPAVPSGGADGSLPGGVDLTDREDFSEWLQEATLGSFLGFRLELTGAFAGGPGDPADQFGFYLLDADPASPGYLWPLFATSDPSGANGLFAVTLDEAPTLHPFATVSVPPVAVWTVTVRTVPEPSPLSLLGLGVLTWGVRRHPAGRA